MRLTGQERRHLASLRRRRAWLETKIEERAKVDPRHGAISFMRAELDAIAWVFALVDEVEDDDDMPPPAAGVGRRGDGGNQRKTE